MTENTKEKRRIMPLCTDKKSGWERVGGVAAFGIVVAAIMTLFGYSVMEDRKRLEPHPAMTQNFAFVPTRSLGDVTVLNLWLRANPNKTVVSFSAVHKGVVGGDGYVVHAVAGDNSRQTCDATDKLPNQWPDMDIQFLQEWMDSHRKVRVVAVAAIPTGGKTEGIRRFAICYEPITATPKNDTAAQ